MELLLNWLFESETAAGTAASYCGVGGCGACGGCCTTCTCPACEGLITIIFCALLVPIPDEFVMLTGVVLEGITVDID